MLLIIFNIENNFELETGIWHISMLDNFDKMLMILNE